MLLVRLAFSCFLIWDPVYLVNALIIDLVKDVNEILTIKIKRKMYDESSFLFHNAYTIKGI